MDAHDEVQTYRVLWGIIMQTLYFGLRTISTMVEMELLSTGVVTYRDLPQEPIFASPRRN